MNIFKKHRILPLGSLGRRLRGKPLALWGFLCGTLGTVGTLAVLSLPSGEAQASAKHTMADFNSMPVNLVQKGAPPRLMIATSTDHQLFYKAYTDYGDLDGDGTMDSTYKHSINYYGYFDSYKCYDYVATTEGEEDGYGGTKNSNGLERGYFTPKAFTTDKYCTGTNDAYWSGNFLNWITMSRIDVVRKILFGGHRRVDSDKMTILERAYLPPDAHSWAKHYKGADLPKLTPFHLNTSIPDDYSSTERVTTKEVRDGKEDRNGYFCDDEHMARCNIPVLSTEEDPTDYKGGDYTPDDTVKCGIAGGKVENGITSCYSNRTWIGVTFGNTTNVTKGHTGYSTEITAPPILKVAAGDYSLWGASEMYQVMWSTSGGGDQEKFHTYSSDSASANRNDNPAKTGIHASKRNPKYGEERLGLGNYSVRVQVCVPTLIDSAAVAAVPGSTKENCKRYPGPDGKLGTDDDTYKPIGILQSYGDDDQILFGMVAGSRYKHAKGGILVKNIRSLKDEVNTKTDGSFRLVSSYATHRTGNPTIGSGIINAWSLYRIVGYKYNVQRISGSDIYEGDSYGPAGDNCTWALTDKSIVTADGRCRMWGNPFAEIFAQAIAYMGGHKESFATTHPYYTDQDSSEVNDKAVKGMPKPEEYDEEWLPDSDYCAKLNILAFNSSVISYDADDLDTDGSSAFKPEEIWKNVLPSGITSTKDMTDEVGTHEGLYNNNYFFGQKDVTTSYDASNPDVGANNQLCTSKELTSLGTAGGLCPEAPRLFGSFRTAGLSYYAHVADINPHVKEEQTVTTYGVALASAIPILSVPAPTGGTEPGVTIIPACRMITGNKVGNCGLVDFRVVEQEVTANKVKGKLFINWESSEQGGDYDADMWGTLDYEYDVKAETIKITTQTQAQSAGASVAFGYVISGTTEDGFHAHSGINQYVREETVDAGSPNCSKDNGMGGCKCTATNGTHAVCDQQGPSSKTYELSTSQSKRLEDPLWYASKYGGFTYDPDNAQESRWPSTPSQWDNQNNSTGGSGSDGIPDNYFYATNPQKLEDSLNRVFQQMQEGTASGTAAAVAPSNSSGEGAIYQSHYEPKSTQGGKTLYWYGTIQSLWADSAGNNRQDCSPIPGELGVDSATGLCLKTPANLSEICKPNGRLDNYCVDQVVQSNYNGKELTAQVLSSATPERFNAYSMEGVVVSYEASSGTLTMQPNSMEANITYDSSAGTIDFEPYSMTAKVTAYNPETGEASITVDSVKGLAGSTASEWYVTTSAGAGRGTTTDTLSLSTGSATIKLEPKGDWLVNWQTAPTYDASGNMTSPGVIDPENPTTITLKTKRRIGKDGSTFSSWTVECVDGSMGIASIRGIDLTLDNSSSRSGITVALDEGSLSGCTQAKFSSYNMQGSEGEYLDRCTVSNLENSGTGTCTASVDLTNTGEVTVQVAPDLAEGLANTSAPQWLNKGDSVLVASYQAQTISFDRIGYIWDAREQLWLDGVNVSSNRIWNDKADTGRYIMTWIDSNLNGKVDTGEYVPFEASLLNAENALKFFDVRDKDEATTVINYVRGEEIPGTRSRTADDNGVSHIMRLGDVMNSSPAVVGAPQEAFDLLYDDMSYREFYRRYLNRRTMVYAGANDGLLHAFNGGFYTTESVTSEDAESVTSEDGMTRSAIKYATSGTKPGGGTAVEHPLGSEIWAYAPGNLLPHLQWLKDPKYGENNTHVSYVDGRPRVFDAKIFNADDDHPKGWGTVLVVGMGQGGGSMELTGFSPSRFTHSAYVVFDVTNPEKAPVLLGEIPLPDGTFTTMYPAVVSFQDTGENKSCNGEACNKWYLLLGSGPSDIRYTTSASAKLYLFDLSQLRTKSGVTPSNPPDACTVQPIQKDAEFKVLTCDTKIANSFMGNPSVLDWQLDYLSDAAYAGVVANDPSKKTSEKHSTDSTDSETSEKHSTDSGSFIKLDFNNSFDMSDWKLNTLVETKLPVSAQPLGGIDGSGNKWVYFGTGRYWNMQDKLTEDVHYLYGVKDPLATPEDKQKAQDSGATVSQTVADSDLLDVSGVNVYTDGTLTSTVTGPSGALSTFGALLNEALGTAAGWKRSLPGLLSVKPEDPSTRNLTRSALTGGILFSTVFQPSNDPCQGLGQSALYGLDYRTGTANPFTRTFGSKIVFVSGTTPSVQYQVSASVQLGTGMASGVSISSGSGQGSNTVTVNTQLSTGQNVATKAQTTESVRSGRVSWEENGQ